MSDNDRSPYTFTLAPLPHHARRYEITVGGVVLGYVYRSTESVERRTPGRRYVNARWERPCWRVEGDDGRARRTRVEAARAAEERR